MSQLVTMVAAVLVSQPEAAEQKAAAPGVAAQTLLEYLRNSGTVGFILLMLSVVAVALVILHMFQARKAKLAPPEVVEGLARMLREGDVDGAIRYCAAPENDSFLAKVFGTGLSRCLRSPLGMLELRKAVEETGQREADKLYRQTDLIGLIAALGPMLGLLGTVFGMIGAFGSISALEGAARSRELAGFMAMALVNTAQGLAVAIPCTAAFSLFRRRIDGLTGELAALSDDLIAVAPSTAKPAGTPPPRPAARPIPVTRPLDLPRN
ncbi:MAG: MotA/TolQ/ExbB proton channel family protein [Phycisphaerales bacterium]